MGFLDYGLAAKAFADGFRQTYITDAEREKERMAIEEAEMQNQIRQAQLAALAKEQANDEAWKKLFTNPILGDTRPPVPQMQGSVGQGLLAIQPNPEFNQPTRDVTNLMGLLQQNASPYEQAIIQALPNMSAKEGATILSSILKNREDNTTKENYYNLRREMDDWRRTNAERDLDRKEKDLERRERSDANKALYAAIRANKRGDGESKAPSLKFQTDYAKASSKKDELIAQMEDIDAHADRLLKTNLSRITGVLGALPNIPGSQGSDAQAVLDSFRSKLGLTTLASLKSGTGAGLGQVTEAEHKLLQNYVSELDNAQSEKAIRDSVKRIQEWSRKAKGRIISGYERSPFGQFDRQQNGESEPVSNSKPRFTIKSVK